MTVIAPNFEFVAYAEHRSRRQEDYDVTLSKEETKVSPDGFLCRLLATRSPTEDPRCSLDIVAVPSSDITALIQSVQEQFAIDGIYIYPAANLHLTITEIIHSVPLEQAESFLRDCGGEKIIHEILKNLPRLQLNNPTISCDLDAIAMSFLPASRFTPSYLKNGIDLKCRAQSIAIQSPRYNLPSAHITIARYTKPIRGVDVLAAKKRADALAAAWQGSWHVEDYESRIGRTWFGGGRVIHSERTEHIPTF